jgi:hypothetical protein
MHMLIWIHLVALDNRFNRETPLFTVRLSILSQSHPLWCLECKIKTYWYLCLNQLIFVFLFLLFQVEPLIILWSTPSLPWSFSRLHHLACTNLNYYIHLVIEVSTRVSSIVQNQSRDFQQGGPRLYYGSCHMQAVFCPPPTRKTKFHSRWNAITL